MSLKSSTQLRVVASNSADFVAGETLGLAAIMGGGDRADAAIYSHEVVGFSKVRFLDLDGLQEVPLLAIAFEVGLSSRTREQDLLFLSGLECYGDARVQQAHRNTIARVVG